MSRITIRDLIVNSCDEARLVNRSQPVPGNIFVSAYALLQKRLNQYSNTNLLSFTRKEVNIEPENWIEKNNWYINSQEHGNILFEDDLYIDGKYVRIPARGNKGRYLVKLNGTLMISTQVGPDTYAWMYAGHFGNSIASKKESNKDFVVGSYNPLPEYEGRIKMSELQYGGGIPMDDDPEYMFSKPDKKMYKKMMLDLYGTTTRPNVIEVQYVSQLPYPEDAHDNRYEGWYFYATVDKVGGSYRGVRGDERGTIYTWVTDVTNPSDEWLNRYIYHIDIIGDELGWVYIGNGADYFESYPDIEVSNLQEVTRFYIANASRKDEWKELDFISYEDLYDQNYSYNVFSVLPLNDSSVKVFVKNDYTGQNFVYKLIYNESFEFNQDSELNVPKQYVALFTAGLVYDLAVQYPRLSDNTVAMLKSRLNELEENVRRSSSVNKLIVRDIDRRGLTYADFINGRFLGR